MAPASAVAHVAAQPIEMYRIGIPAGSNLPQQRCPAGQSSGPSHVVPNVTLHAGAPPPPPAPDAPDAPPELVVDPPVARRPPVPLPPAPESPVALRVGSSDPQPVNVETAAKTAAALTTDKERFLIVTRFASLLAA